MRTEGQNQMKKMSFHEVYKGDPVVYSGCIVWLTVPKNSSSEDQKLKSTDLF